MFGHQNSTDQSNGVHPAPTAAGAFGSNGSQTITPSTAPPTDTSTPGDYVMTDLPPTHPGTASASPLGSTPSLTPAASAPATGVHDEGGEGQSSDLLELKQAALQELQPLVGHLEQSAEEKFRTTMMMIQASDDQTLLKQALESAKQITDEKARAQALLDVVNEINYFTQHHGE